MFVQGNTNDVREQRLVEPRVMLAIVSNTYLRCALRLMYQDVVLTLKNTARTLLQGNRPPGGESNALPANYDVGFVITGYH